jgi:hypothetical protein
MPNTYFLSNPPQNLTIKYLGLQIAWAAHPAMGYLNNMQASLRTLLLKISKRSISNFVDNLIQLKSMIRRLSSPALQSLPIATNVSTVSKNFSKPKQSLLGILKLSILISRTKLLSAREESLLLHSLQVLNTILETVPGFSLTILAKMQDLSIISKIIWKTKTTKKSGTIMDSIATYFTTMGSMFRDLAGIPCIWQDSKTHQNFQAVIH